MGKVATVAERIREGLRVREMSQKELAEASGCTQSCISVYVHGRGVPKHSAIAAIADALNCDEGWLLGYDVPMYRMPDELRFLSGKQLSEVQERLMLGVLHGSEEELARLDAYASATDLQRRIVSLILTADDATLLRIMVSLHEAKD